MNLKDLVETREFNLSMKFLNKKVRVYKDDEK